MFLAYSWLLPVMSLLQSSMPAIMTMLADHAAQQLLDFNQKLDINLLDNVVNCLYHGVGPQVCCEAFLCMSCDTVCVCVCLCVKLMIYSKLKEDSYFIEVAEILSVPIAQLVQNRSSDTFFMVHLSYVSILAKNGSRSVDTLKRAPRCLDKSGHHPWVLPEHEYQSKLPLV